MDRGDVWLSAQPLSKQSVVPNVIPIMDVPIVSGDATITSPLPDMEMPDLIYVGTAEGYISIDADIGAFSAEILLGRTNNY